MGARGPAPKRSDQRRRTNAPEVPVTKAPGAAPGFKVPAVSPKWHPAVKSWFRSLKDSGQSVFYEPSDWATAFVVAEFMSRELNDGVLVKAASMQAFLKACSTLMVTEGDRRRASLELQRMMPGSPDLDDDDEDGVTDLDEYRRQFGAG